MADQFTFNLGGWGVTAGLLALVAASNFSTLTLIGVQWIAGAAGFAALIVGGTALGVWRLRRRTSTPNALPDPLSPYPFLPRARALQPEASVVFEAPEGDLAAGGEAAPAEPAESVLPPGAIAPAGRASAVDLVPPLAEPPLVEPPLPPPGEPAPEPADEAQPEAEAGEEPVVADETPEETPPEPAAAVAEDVTAEAETQPAAGPAPPEAASAVDLVAPLDALPLPEPPMPKAPRSRARGRDSEPA
jgi:hypothetical protein